jgi:tRNA(His) 5'-end guanylyltransferase
MDKTSLGDRMKEYYEKPYKIKLPMRMPVIIRLDGKAFHTVTKDLEKPFDLGFINMMDNTAICLCVNIQGAMIAYVQSDEISILLHNYKRLNSQAWLGNELQKMVSISAALASSYFSHFLAKYNKSNPVQFDSRVFILPEAEVCNYFIWRQQDWERNSIQMLAQSLYSHKELMNKNMADMQEMCFQKGKNWNNLKTFLRRGRCVVKKADVISNKTYWSTDSEIPIFKKNRNYIEKHLEVLED